MIYYAYVYIDIIFYSRIQCCSDGGVYIYTGEKYDSNNNSNNINKTKLDVCFGFRAHPRTHIIFIV